MYGFLSQFSVRLGPTVTSLPNEYLVRAYTYVLVPGTLFRRATLQWVQMHQYDRNFPGTEGVGPYVDELCARGRGLGPVIRTSSGARNSPVIVRLFRNDEGVWVLERECRK